MKRFKSYNKSKHQTITEFFDDSLRTRAYKIIARDGIAHVGVYRDDTNSKRRLSRVYTVKALKKIEEKLRPMMPDECVDLRSLVDDDNGLSFEFLSKLFDVVGLGSTGNYYREGVARPVKCYSRSKAYEVINYIGGMRRYVNGVHER